MLKGHVDTDNRMRFQYEGLKSSRERRMARPSGFIQQHSEQGSKELVMMLKDRLIFLKTKMLKMQTDEPITYLVAKRQSQMLIHQRNTHLFNHPEYLFMAYYISMWHQSEHVMDTNSFGLWKTFIKQVQLLAKICYGKKQCTERLSTHTAG